MKKIKKTQKKVHPLGVWPLIAVVVFSMIAGGIVYAFAFQNMLYDDIYSTVLSPSRQKNTSQSKTPLAKVAGAHTKAVQK